MDDGTTPLFLASQTGRLEIVRLLLKANADKDKTKTDGTNPLHPAMEKGHLGIMQLLLEANDKAKNAVATSFKSPRRTAVQKFGGCRSHAEHPSS